MSECEHTTLRQTSKQIVRWTWNRQDDSTYEPEDTHDKVLWEETLEWECSDCDAIVSLDDDLHLEVDS